LKQILNRAIIVGVTQFIIITLVAPSIFNFEHYSENIIFDWRQNFWCDLIDFSCDHLHFHEIIAKSSLLILLISFIIFYFRLFKYYFHNKVVHLTLLCFSIFAIVNFSLHFFVSSGIAIRTAGITNGIIAAIMMSRFFVLKRHMLFYMGLIVVILTLLMYLLLIIDKCPSILNVIYKINYIVILLWVVTANFEMNYYKIGR